MPTSPPTFRPPWMPAPVELRRAADRWRGSSRERGYTGAWDKASKRFLRGHPLCVCCEANGGDEAASLTDHIIPHRGDMMLFWDESNWQALCAWCHNSIKKPLEHRGAPPSDLRLDRVVEGWLPRRR